jgi:hypothetical protein
MRQLMAAMAAAALVVMSGRALFAREWSASTSLRFRDDPQDGGLVVCRFDAE